MSLTSKARTLRAIHHRSAALLALCVYWLAQAALVDPRGEFPLNDDAFYADAARRLLGQGTLEIHPGAQAAAVAHVAWGALFCLPFGFSFTALRISGLTAGFAGVLAVYGLLRVVGRTPAGAHLGALVIATNPLYLVLAHSFMTDVPFLALATSSLLVMGYAVRQGGVASMFASAALSSAASLVRQVGLVTPLAFACAYLSRHGVTPRRVGVALMPGAAALAVSVLWEFGRHGAIRIPAESWLRSSLARPLPLVLASWTTHAVTAILYLGLWLLPLLVALRMRLTSLGLACGVAFGVLTSEVLLITGRRMPLSGNVLHRAGLGPLTLRGAEFGMSLPPSLWTAVTAAAVIGAGLLVARIVSLLHLCWLRRGRQKAAILWRVSLAATACGMCAPFLMVGHFDRYLLPALPPVALLICTAGAARHGLRILAAGALCAVYAAFGIAATHDYLSWNRTRWSAVDGLLQQRVPPHEIDAGYELSLWTRLSGGASANWIQPPRARFVIALGPIPGYSEIGRLPYDRWVGVQLGEILVLRRVAGQLEPSR